MHETALSQAIAMHQGGQLSSAAQLYEEILARDEGNADALHLLGVLHFQQGAHHRAVAEIGRAIAARPNVPAFHANLAEAYRAQGKYERAVGCCRIALRLSPDYAEALCNLGLGLQGLGRQSRGCRAVPPCRRSPAGLRHRPQQSGRQSPRTRPVRRSPWFISAGPSNWRRSTPQARTNLGQMLVDRGQAEEGLPHCQEAVCLQPDSAAFAPQPGQRPAGLGATGRGPQCLPGGHPPGSEPGPVPCAPWACAAARGPARRRARLAEAGDGACNRGTPPSGRIWRNYTGSGKNLPRPFPAGKRRWPPSPSGRPHTTASPGRSRTKDGWRKPKNTIVQPCACSPISPRPV